MQNNFVLNGFLYKVGETIQSEVNNKIEFWNILFYYQCIHLAPQSREIAQLQSDLKEMKYTNEGLKQKVRMVAAVLNLL